MKLVWPLLVASFLQCAMADDFDSLRLRWRDFITGGTNINLADSVIASRVSSIANTANNYWNSMNKAADRTNLWSDAASTTISAHLTTCYSRLSAMAQGWATAGSSLYGNSSLANDIVAGLDWMYTNRYNEAKSEYNNWWDWEIGVPMALNNAMVQMYPVLSGAQITNYCNAIDRFSPTVTMTGANRVWKAYAVGVRGAVGRNASKVAAARDGLSDVSGSGAQSVFSYVTSGDGFYRDGSFIQHGKHPYTAGYGISLIRELSKLLTWLDGSPWVVTDTSRTNVLQWCFDSYEPLIYCGALPEHLRGREVSRNSSGFSAGHGAINAMLRLSRTAPEREASRLKSMVKYWGQVDTTATLASYVDIDLVAYAEALMADSTVVARGELVRHFQFPSMDRVMHLRPGYGFGLSMFSTRIYNYECINSENWHGWFTSTGMAYLWNNDLTQFTDAFWPTVDPYHLPGTTVLQATLANGVNQSKTSPQPWVGGAVVSDSFGTAGMGLADVNSSLRGAKSWFMFDDEVVCLGAGISCTNAAVVHTTVENRRLNSSGNNALTVNDAAMPLLLGWSSNLTQVSWCALDKAGGYYFPQPANLTAARQARAGKWADINAGGSTTSYTRNYLSLIWDHGAQPSNVSYAYVLLPNYSAAAVRQYAANPNSSILTNSGTVQAVRESRLGILAANFWADGPQTVDTLTASGKCAVLLRETNAVLEVAASDPTWTNSGTVTLTVARKGLSVLSADVGLTVLQLSPTIRISISTGGARGKTFQARLALPTNITAVADSAATGCSTPTWIDVLANDVGLGSSLSLATVTQPGSGTASPQAGRVLYVPAPGFTGADAFSYTVTDGQYYATGAVAVVVGAANLALTPGQVACSSYQTGNGPENTVDGDLGTRWSAQGDGQWLQFDLLSTQLVDAVSVAFFSGTNRYAYFDLLVSQDSNVWAKVFSGRSSGTTDNLQRFDLPDRWARYVRFLGHSNSVSDWNSVTEVLIHTGTNAAPVAVADAAAIRVGQSLTLDALANDYDPDQGPQRLAVSSLSQAGHGTATRSGDMLSYVPAPAFSGRDSFSYVVSDTGLSATGLVTVLVTNVLPPVLYASARGNQLELTIAGTPGISNVVQASSNLVSWTTLLTTNPAAVPFLFSEPLSPVYSTRFYRAILNP